MTVLLEDPGTGEQTAIRAEGTDQDARALLERHACPMSFPEARVWLLGRMISLAQNDTPVEAITELWGGTLPTLPSVAETVRFFNVLTEGLWRRLARHAQRAVPFHLTRIEIGKDRAGLIRLAALRGEELEAFGRGFAADLDKGKPLPRLPEQAIRHFARITQGAQVIAVLVAAVEAPENLLPDSEILRAIAMLSDLTRSWERAIHELVILGMRAREADRRLAGIAPLR